MNPLTVKQSCCSSCIAKPIHDDISLKSHHCEYKFCTVVCCKDKESIAHPIDSTI